MSNRYDVSGAAEGQFEPGSNNQVLRNLRGIIDPGGVDRLETSELARALGELIHEIDASHRFLAADICSMLERWLGGVYSWAGAYRSVNMKKDGFPFAAAHLIERLMADLEAGPLARFTPCTFSDADALAAALAELPLLDFGPLTGAARERYFAAVRAGWDRNYEPMKALFAKIISATERG